MWTLEHLSPRRRAEHSLYADVFDLQMADRIAALEMVRQTVEVESETYPPALRLFQDALLGLYKAAPRQKGVEQVVPSHRLNHAVMGKAMEEHAFAELRRHTRLDPALAMLGAVNLWEELMALLLAEHKEASRQAAVHEEEAMQIERQAEAAQALAQAAAEAGKEKADQFQKLAAELQAQAQEARRKAEAAMQQVRVPSAQAVYRAVKEAAKRTEEMAEALDGWGLNPGVLQKVPLEERMALAERLMQSDKLRRLAALVGRFRNLAIAAQAKKTERTPGQIEGVELGGDLDRLLPAELALLRHPVLRRDLYRRLVERQVMQYRMTGRRKRALGPLVVCYDESGSMAGSKELWAKAVVLALLFIARRQGRPFAAIAFGSAEEIRVKRIEQPQTATMADILEVAEPFFDGGTDFHRPLMEARRIIAEGGHFARADIVFITDGEASVTASFSAEFTAFKKKYGTRVFAVLVDVGASTEQSVRLWADRVYRVLDLADMQAASSAASTVFENIV